MHSYQDWHVAESNQMTWLHNRHRKCGFKTGFIKTRECPTSICGLKFAAHNVSEKGEDFG